MVQSRVAVVTGANRGIGLEIAAQLAGHGMRVVLTARDVARGRSAQRQLAERGIETRFHQLDVTEPASIRVLKAYLEDEFGSPDVLVNSAGVLLDPKGSRLLGLRADVVRMTLDTNVLGPMELLQALVPLMQARGYGRVVNVSSGMGQLSDMGAGSPAYRISKAALNALTRTLAAELEGSNVLVNAMCPGWVRTDMGGADAPRSVAEGADTAVFLATLPDGGPSGGFFRDRQPVAW